jgi:hypothetical protein
MINSTERRPCSNIALFPGATWGEGEQFRFCRGRFAVRLAIAPGRRRPSLLLSQSGGRSGLSWAAVSPPHPSSPGCALPSKASDGSLTLIARQISIRHAIPDPIPLLPIRLFHRPRETPPSEGNRPRTRPSTGLRSGLDSCFPGPSSTPPFFAEDVPFLKRGIEQGDKFLWGD